jgi:hypothetical protein
MDQIDDRILSLVKDGLAFPEQFNIGPKTIKELVCDLVYERFIPAGPLTCAYNFQEEMLNPKQCYHRMYEYGNSTRWYNNLIGKCLRRMGSRMRKNTASYWLIDLCQPANQQLIKDNPDILNFVNNYKKSYINNNHKTPKRDQLAAA